MNARQRRKWRRVFLYGDRQKFYERFKNSKWEGTQLFVPKEINYKNDFYGIRSFYKTINNDKRLLVYRA